MNGGGPLTGRVAIVGGGLAGIAAALRCHDAGLKATLVDVRPRLGGAAYSFEREGLVLDNGQHVFLRCCTDYIGLLERLGSRALTKLQPRLAIPAVAPGGRVAWLRRSDLPAPWHLAGALAGYGHLSPRDRLNAARAALALARLDPDDPRLDSIAFGDWLAEHGQSPAALAALWELIARPTLNLPASEASLALAAYVFQTGLLGNASAGDIGWAQAPLSDVHDAPARRALADAGVDVRLRWRATRIAQEDGAWTVEGETGRLTADAVIVAIPHDAPATKMPALIIPNVTSGPEGQQSNLMVSEKVHPSRLERDCASASSLRQTCRGTLRVPRIGREASRPYNFNHRFANFLRVHKLVLSPRN